MMTIDDDRLIEHILNLSDDSERSEVEQALSSSAQLRERAAKLRDMLSSAAYSAPPVAPNPGLFERIERSLEPEQRFHGFVERLSAFLDLPSERVVELLNEMDDATQWLRGPQAGVEVRPLRGGKRLAGRECAIMKIAPGTSFPIHRHAGHEWGFVIQGEATEDTGKVSKPGDIVHKPPDSIHSFSTGGEEPFIFFVVHDGIEFC